MMSSQKTGEKTSIPVLKCKECGKELPDLKNSYKVDDERIIKGQVIKTHWYLCSTCALEFRCNKCGKELLSSTDRYRFYTKEVINWQVVKTHGYLCRPCALEEVTPKCENVKENCEISEPGDPELRISKLKYDGGRGETVCKACGLVQEEISLSAMSGVSNHHFPRPKEPKNYIKTVQQLADDPQVDWFNYAEDSIKITCKAGDMYNLLFRYPEAEIIII